MADSGFSLKKLFNWLDGFLKTMSSPMDGWDMANVKVKQEGDNFSSYFSFKNESALKDDRTGEDISNNLGNKIELDILLKVINGQAVLSPIMAGLNNMSQNDTGAGKALLNVLFGEADAQEQGNSENQGNPDEQSDDTADSDDQATSDESSNSDEQTNPDESISNNTVVSNGLSNIFASDFTRFDTAKKNGTGLLGTDLTKVNSIKDLPDTGGDFDGKHWSWDEIAFDYLKYAIECQVPGKDYGAIENVTLGDCSALISEYLVRQDVIMDASEVKADPSLLVLPILCRMQAALGEYFDNAYKQNPGIQEVEDAVYEAEAPKSEPETVAVFDPNGNFAEHVDISTPDGQAHLQELQSQGYTTMDSSKRIDAKLRKINGSIDLLALQSNYNPAETLDDLEDAIYQDEFMDTLTEEPQAFSINVDDDGYDIEQCESCEVDPCTSLNSVMNTAIVMYRNLYILHWMAKGNDMMKLHILTEELYGELIQEIDTLGELLVEKCGTVQNLDFEWSPIAVRDYEFQEGLVILKDFIQNYIDTIDYAYPNQTSDVQSTLDEWLRYWNKQMNYFIKNQEEVI